MVVANVDGLSGQLNEVRIHRSSTALESGSSKTVCELPTRSVSAQLNTERTSKTNLGEEESHTRGISLPSLSLRFGGNDILKAVELKCLRLRQAGCRCVSNEQREGSVEWVLNRVNE